MNHVYRILNTENGKSYIGITSRDVKERWNEHISRARNGVRNSRIYAAIRKYGVEKFEIVTIDSTDCENHLRELEMRYIQEFDSYENGYNCNLGGQGVLVFPDEIRAKISKALKGKAVSKETRRKMSAAKLGNSQYAEHLGEHTAKGAENPRAKYFLIRTPDGIIEVGRGIRAYCRKHNLLHCKLSSNKQTKGFKLLGTFRDYPEREYNQAVGSAIRPQWAKI